MSEKKSAGVKKLATGDQRSPTLKKILASVIGPPEQKFARAPLFLSAALPEIVKIVKSQTKAAISFTKLPEGNSNYFW
jgi:hypothetical protein